MGVPIVDALGTDIERRWGARDYDGPSFQSICVEGLTAARLHESLRPDEIVSWVFRGELPEQADPRAGFGQPPVTLFRSRRFHIAALFWVDGTTTIHDHGFSGAFQVLSGASIETQFTFDPCRDIGGQLRFGTLQPRGSALLTKGDVRPITAGPSCIHSLFHLSRPAVSVVVRTFAEVSQGPQLNYVPPGIAYNGFHVDPTLDRMVQIAEMLRKTDERSFDEQVGALVEKADLHTAFVIIKSCLHVPNPDRLARLIQRVRDSQARELFAEWARHAERNSFIKTRRAMVHDPDLRFLLAVLLNSHRRVDALALVASYASEVPAARQIASWLNKLSTVTMRLRLADGAWEPSLLALPPFTDRLEDVLTAALENRNAAHDDEELAFIEELRSLPALMPLFR